MLIRLRFLRELRCVLGSGFSMWDKADSVILFYHSCFCSCACGSNSSIDHGRRSWEWTYGTSISKC